MQTRSRPGSRDKFLTAGLSAGGVASLMVACLWPVWTRWSTSVVGPFGGMDAVFQAGLVQWSAHTWWRPQVWQELPIFHPVPGAIGFMDSLVGQAWLVWPLAALFRPTAAFLYNTAFLGTLILAALGMGFLYRASGGRWWAAGTASLALLGAPYTASQLGHLNQLPPPFVLFALGSLIAGLRRQDAGLPASRWWWLLGVFLVLQAAWGWYGFAYAVIGVAVIKTTWLMHRTKRGSLDGRTIWQLMSQALLPSVLALVGVLVLAQPQLQLAERYEGFQRSDEEVRQGSADFHHLLNRGAYRSGPSDWAGRSLSGEERYSAHHRQVLHPGWLVLGLAAVGWWRRGYLSFQQRRIGRALLIMGGVGLVLSFGDSVGLPFTDRRLPLPLDLLREAVPPFKAFRGAWRFSWLMVIGLSWWTAVAIQQMVDRQGHRLVQSWFPVALLILLTLVSLPVQVPSLDLEIAAVPAPGDPAEWPSVLTLPAPTFEYNEDVMEARWLLRAVATGRRVTGGVSGWVPPEVADLRRRLEAIEQGQEPAAEFLAEMKVAGVQQVELALRSGDQERVAFWREVLNKNKARLMAAWPHDDYETYEMN